MTDSQWIAGPAWSNLDINSFGYDIVIAVTQAALNQQVKTFVVETVHNTKTLCWVKSDNGQPVLTDYTTLKQKAGVDPFDIEDGSKDHDRISKLTSLKLMFAAQFQMGLPQSIDTEPAHVLTFDNNQSVSVWPVFVFFQLVVVGDNLGFPGMWRNLAQADNNPWNWVANCNMTNLSNSSDADLSSLGPAVNNKAAKLRKAQINFSVVSTVLNFGTSSATYWNILVVDASGRQLEDGINKYLGQLAPAIYESLFGSSLALMTMIKPSSATLLPTSIEYMLNPFVGNDGNPISPPPNADCENVRTLNYICTIENRPLPATNRFTWNWVLPEKVNLVHGVIVIRRNDFRDWLQARMSASITKACWKMIYYGGSDQPLWLTDSHDTPTYNYPVFGLNLFSATSTFDWLPESAMRGYLDVSRLLQKPEATYTCQVFVTNHESKNTCVTINQNFHVSGVNVANNEALSFINTSWNDTYTLDVNDAGKLRWTHTKEEGPTDSAPFALSAIPFFQNFTDTANAFAVGMRNHMGNMKLDLVENASSTPGSDLNEFVFVGNKTFSYKDVSFSDNGDLLANLHYLSVN